MIRVTVMGLGAMGRRIDVRIAVAGHPVTVWSRTHAIAADLAMEIGGIDAERSLVAAASQADVVMAMVTDEAASRSMWIDGGALDALDADAIAVEGSTLSTEWTAELTFRAAQSDTAFVVAPVVGSRPQAESGALLSIVGGEPATIDRLFPVVDTYSARAHTVPGPSDAATLKLLINGLFAAQAGLFGEVAGMVERSTLPTDETLELIAGLPITAPGMSRILGLYAHRQFDPNFPVALVAKISGIWSKPLATRAPSLR